MAKVICVFGDSISWGYNDLDKGGWVDRLKMYFMEHGNNSVFVYNSGIESNTSDDLLGRFEDELNHRINIKHVDKTWKYFSSIVFAIGKNDSLFNGDRNNTWVSVEKFEENIRELIKKSKKYTDKIMFVGLGKVDESMTIPVEDNGDSYCNENLLEYNSIIEKVCMENNLNFVSINDILSIECLSDGVHPNSIGHEKMFRKILPNIEVMIGRGNES